MRLLAKALIAVSLCAATVGVIPTATAQEAAIDSETRMAAKRLGAEALVLFAQKDYEGALEKFEKAGSLVPAPTLSLYRARCLAELGRLVESSEVYLEVTKADLPADAPYVHKKAQVEAKAERDQLLPRIPSLIVEVDGGKPETVEIDGRSIPLELIGSQRPTDPGKHRVVAKAGEDWAEQTVTLEESEARTVKLVLPIPEPEAPPPTPEKRTQETIWPMLARTSFVVGSTGALVGISHGIVALAQDASLADQCPNGQCPPDAQGQSDFFDLTRGVTTTGLIAGVLGGLAGGAILLFAPMEEEVLVERDEPAAQLVVVPIIDLAAPAAHGGCRGASCSRRPEDEALSPQSTVPPEATLGIAVSGTF